MATFSECIHPGVKFFLLYWISLFTQCPLTVSQCGYEACNLGIPGHLNVHLIPHTHDDVGWLKTVDQYYYGSQNYIQKAGVQYILDTVIQALAADPQRRFTYVEMAFFTRWWRSQTLATRQLVIDLVKSNRLQFALGAWSMADEASVYYGDAIDQMTRGRDVLRRLFGECGIPKVSWQIDPFGHSRDHAELFRDAGFDGVFFQRMDYREKLARRASKSLEVLWDTGVSRTPNEPGLFTSMFYDSYCYPSNFCFDDKCYDPPIQDDPLMEDYNVNERVDMFLGYINQVRGAFATNHILVMMGCDFTYENANMNFKNTDKLIKYANQRQNYGSTINLLYSTPECYTKAVNVELKKNRTIERRAGDFFPYASGPNSYWTGYYTSRPNLKRFVRQASTLLTMCEQVHLFSNRMIKPRHKAMQDWPDSLVDELRQAMGVMQHHDAVTGTEKQHVANDYARILSRASKSCQHLISRSMAKLIPRLLEKTGGILPGFCDLLNVSVCEATEGWKPYLNGTGHGGVYIFVYNPTAWNLWSSWVRIPIYLEESQREHVRIILRNVRDSPTIYMTYQLVPISEETLSIPERHASPRKANYELIFNAAAAGPLILPTGFSVFHLALESLQFRSWILRRTRRTFRGMRYAHCSRVTRNQQTTQFHLKLDEQAENPLTIEAVHLETGMIHSIKVDMFYYYGETTGSQYSGAYVFLPKFRNTNQTFDKPIYKVYKGDCVEEVHLIYDTWASLVVRLYSDGELELQWTVGPIPDGWYQFSREVVLRYTVSGEAIAPAVPGEFFTDSAGRRLIRRIRNRRPYWNISEPFVETQPVAGNYYPVVNRIVLKGSPPPTEADQLEKRPAMGLAVYTDRSQGGSSLQDGQVELMLHRRLVRDDGYGVGEALMEKGEDRKGLIARGRHWLRFDELAVIEREDAVISKIATKEPVVIFAPSVQKPTDSGLTGWMALNYALPPQLHLLSLSTWPLLRSAVEPTTPEQILLRIEHLILHMDVVAEEKSYQLDVTYLFRGVRITGATEVTLTADQELQAVKSNRLRWPTERNDSNLFWSYTHHVNQNPNVVTLSIAPGTIASFILDYELID